MSIPEALLSRSTLGRNALARSGPRLTIPPRRPPPQIDLIHLGAKFSPCIRKDQQIEQLVLPGARPGAGLGLLCPKRPFGLHPDPRKDCSVGAWALQPLPAPCRPEPLQLG